MFPEPLEKQSNGSAHHSGDSDASASQEIVETFEHGKDSKTEAVSSPSQLSFLAWSDFD